MSQEQNSLSSQIGHVLTGRILSFALMFFLPVVLVRLFSQEIFGLYRQFFLVFYALFTLLQLGMSVSLSSLIPRNPGKARAIISATVFFLSIIAAICLIAGGLLQWYGGAHPLWSYGLLLGTLTGVMIASSPFEHILLWEQQSRKVALLIVLWDLARGGFLLLAAVLTQDLAVALWVMTAAAVIRYLVMLGYLKKNYHISIQAIDVPLFVSQLREAGPLTLQAGAHLFEINVDRYLVMLFFSASTFAVYTVGAFQLPLVDMLFSSVCGVLLPRLSGLYARGDKERLVELYRESIRRMLLVLVPLVGALFVVRRPLIIFLFSERYAESVSLFSIYLWIIPTYATLSCLVLQAMGHNRYLSLSSVVKAIMAIGLVSMGGWLGGVHGVVAMLVLYHYLAAALIIMLTADALDISWRALFPWQSALMLGGFLLVSLAAVEWLFAGLAWPHWLSLATKPLIFLLLFATALWCSPTLSLSDRSWLMASIRRLTHRWHRLFPRHNKTKPEASALH